MAAGGQERGPDIYALFGQHLSWEFHQERSKGHKLYCVQQDVYRIVYGTSNTTHHFSYFLIRAGAVNPAESPLSPAYVAPEPCSSSLDPQEPVINATEGERPV